MDKNCQFHSGDFKEGTEPDGFRGVKWGVTVKDLPEMQHLLDDMEISLYTKKNDVMEIGRSKIEGISYIFWKDMFFSVKITAAGHSNYEALKQTTFAKFGEGYENHMETEESFGYKGDKTIVKLFYDDKKDKGHLTITSAEISCKKNKWEEEKAREGAEKGF